jgi:hypothetical protein
VEPLPADLLLCDSGIEEEVEDEEDCVRGYNGKRGRRLSSGTSLALGLISVTAGAAFAVKYHLQVVDKYGDFSGKVYQQMLFVLF